MDSPRATSAGPADTRANGNLLGGGSVPSISDPLDPRQHFLSLPGAPRLVGLTAAAATVDDYDAVEDAFEPLTDEEARGLAEAVTARLAEEAQRTGNWKPWAEFQHIARRAEFHEAGTKLRASLDAAVNQRQNWEIRMQRAERKRAERELRRDVSPLIHQGAAKARIEEVAGIYAEPRGPLPWPAVFRVLNETFDAAHAAGGRR